MPGIGGLHTDSGRASHLVERLCVLTRSHGGGWVHGSLGSWTAGTVGSRTTGHRAGRPVAFRFLVVVTRRRNRRRHAPRRGPVPGGRRERHRCRDVPKRCGEWLVTVDAMGMASTKNEARTGFGRCAVIRWGKPYAKHTRLRGASSLWPKSIRGLWPPDERRCSRDLRLRHLIGEARQAVRPQPANSCWRWSIRDEQSAVGGEPAAAPRSRAAW